MFEPEISHKISKVIVNSFDIIFGEINSHSIKNPPIGMVNVFCDTKREAIRPGVRTKQCTIQVSKIINVDVKLKFVPPFLLTLRKL